MTPVELARLAAAVNLLRPDWPTASLQTLLKAHAHRPLRDIAVALTWIATDPDTRNPGRLDEPGPWWQASRTSDTPTAVNGCEWHGESTIRIDHHGRQFCAGCWTDTNAADQPLPLERHGVPPDPQTRQTIVTAIHTAHGEPKPRPRTKPLSPDVMATVRAQLEQARTADATTGTHATDPATSPVETPDVSGSSAGSSPASHVS